MSQRKPTIKPRDIQGAKYLEQIIDLLRPLHDHCDDPKRTLHYDQYCAYLLLYFITPALDSMRGLQQVSGLGKIKNKMGLPRFSLGSFSEAGTVFDPELLLTDLEDLDVSLIALLYHHRWQIELFFRWFKKVLQADRPLSLSQNGMTIVAYCALIASLLVVLWTGRKPTNRTFELICF